MFDISCGDDGGPASCGIFGGSVGGGGGAKQPQTLAGLLKKLDLSEYEPKFVAAGITDVLRPASRFRSVPSDTSHAIVATRAKRRCPTTHNRAQVASLAELSEEELDKFDMRKLEKRKLRHHLQSAWVPDGVALRC